MKKYFETFYIVGRGGYGKQLSIMLKTNKIIRRSLFVDDKIKFNLNKFYKLKDKINFSVIIGTPALREKIYKFLKKKKNLNYSTLILSNTNLYTKKIGQGSIIEHNVLVSNNVSIGIGCLLLTDL